MKDLLTGWLLTDPESGTLSDVIQKAIFQPDGKLIEARNVFHRVDAKYMRRIVGTRIMNDPKFAIILYVVMLCCVTNGFSVNKILSATFQGFIATFYKAVGHDQ
jgi:hypothetical protein